MDEEEHNIEACDYEPKTVRRVRKFQILKGSNEFKKLDDLCLKARNMFNYTLHILRQLHFASNLKEDGKHDAEFYLSKIDERVRKYIVSKTIKSGKRKGSLKYSIEYPKKGGNGVLKNEQALFSIFLEMEQFDYTAVQSTAARNAAKLAVKSMKSYYMSMDSYFKNPEKFKAMPELPRYRKKKWMRAVFAVDSFRTNDDGSVTINGDCKLGNVYISKEMVDDGAKVKQIRVVPQTTMDVFDVEVIYEKELKPIDWLSIDQNRVIAIDIGVNTVCALTTTDGNALLMNGRPLKNINQFYNKQLAAINRKYSKLGIRRGKKRKMLDRKRRNKIGTFIHQLSRFIVDYAKDNGFGRIIIGHNDGWKQEPFKDDKGQERKRKNQNFVQIPFNDVIKKMTYKAEEYGIVVDEIKESFTSKCSALDDEVIEDHTESGYMGTRSGKHNKEYTTAHGILVNADVNGSLNIMRLGTVGPKGKTIGNLDNTILTPPKFSKVGRISYKTFKNENEKEKITQINKENNIVNITKSSPRVSCEGHIEIEAAVDSRCDGIDETLILHKVA
jgi:putative transposase